MPQILFKGNPNRAHDYVCDIERWTCYARAWLKGWGGGAPNSEQAMEALNKAEDAVRKAMKYIRTGQELPTEGGN